MTTKRTPWRRLMPVASGLMGLLLGATAFLRYEQDSIEAATALLAD